MRSATISIPSPCSQSWASMTPTTGGRHCSSCQETVADFTTMTDSEVIAFLRQYPSISCGRFRENQLSRPLLAAAQPVTGWRRWLGTTVALLGMGSLLAPKAQGQGQGQDGRSSYAGGPEPIVATDQITTGEAPKGVSSLAPIPDSVLLVKGVVRNRWGLRQSEARVRISLHSTTTDEQGRFELLIPRTNLPANLQLVVSYWNAEHGSRLFIRVPVDMTRTQPYTIYLKKQERILMGSPKFR